MNDKEYLWRIADGYPEGNGCKVFSCFSGGGGSTMGYKLAGYEVIGNCEIDPRMNEVYIANHHPMFNFCEPIQDLKKRKDLPDELYHLDVLDGSPPCSSFSMSGDREKQWGKKKKFKEGQAKQVLDTLFFDFIDLAKRLQPKVVIAENVKGLLLGNAKKYVAKIYKELEGAGYYVRHFLLNGADMGLPQRRERVFFVCLRKDLATPLLENNGFFERRPRIEMEFNHPHIPISEVTDYMGDEITIGGVIRKLWMYRMPGDRSQEEANVRLYGKVANFNQMYAYQDLICPTVASKKSGIIHFDRPLYLSVTELMKVSSFPLDYDFKGQTPYYICGMSVPPQMMKRVSQEVYKQWLKVIK